MSNPPDNSSILWQGSSWRFRVVHLQLSDGTSVDRGIIEHPGSVLIIPLVDDQVIMLKQYRLAMGNIILELPAGTRGWNEDFEVCAQRELREETGYRAERWTDLGRVWPGPGLTNEVMAVFLAEELIHAPLPPDVDEEIEVCPIPLNELNKMAINGQMQDAKSIVGILRAVAHLG